MATDVSMNKRNKTLGKYVSHEGENYDEYIEIQAFFSRLGNKSGKILL